MTWRPKSISSPKKRSIISNVTPTPARVALTLERNDGELLLRISDDGRGFDAGQIDDAERFGLTGHV